MTDVRPVRPNSQEDLRQLGAEDHDKESAEQLIAAGHRMTLPASSRKRKPWRWNGNVLIMDNSVVGCVSRAAFDYFAYGCMSEWMDTDLGVHKSERAAKRAVESWVSENEC